MMRGRGVSFVFAAVLLGFALVASASAQTPPPAPDAALAAVFAATSLPQAPPSGLMPAPTNQCGPYCSTFSAYTSATISGSGSDCTHAQSSLMSQIQNIAATTCRNDTGFGQCNLVIHDTTSCTLIAPGTWQVQGYGTYNCRDTTC
jgi:hypothetical protein